MSDPFGSPAIVQGPGLMISDELIVLNVPEVALPFSSDLDP